METNTPQPTSDTWVEDGPFRIRSERGPNELYVVEPYGELDLAASKTLDAELRRVEASDVDRIIVDLSRLEFIDSSGIQVLMEAEARSRQDSHRVRFLHGQGQVARILELIHADSVLSFAD